MKEVKMMIIRWDEVERNRSKYVLIDVRSPAEFHEATIPGALNIPLFSNEERAEVGTIYKQHSPETAKSRGLDIVSPKLPDLIKGIQAHLQPNQEAVIFCWRGGMRSKSLVTVSDWMGIKTHQLQGGYRAYRHHINNELENIDWKAEFIVLHGNTGVGKTTLLEALESKGYPVINLEQMADHRGSIFGRIGLNGYHSQKMFDSLLLDKIKELKNQPLVFVEAESKRIGQIFLPHFVLEKKEQGIHIMVEASLSIQVERIIEEYHRSDVKGEQFLEAFSKISKRMPVETRDQIEQALLQSNLKVAVELLMTEYYNPRYTHARTQYAHKIDAVVDANSLEHATNELILIYQAQLVQKKSTVH
jgi:tRNA 2-selenouridine synthase